MIARSMVLAFVLGGCVHAGVHANPLRGFEKPRGGDRLAQTAPPTAPAPVERERFQAATLSNGLRAWMLPRPWSMDARAALVCTRAGDEDPRLPAGSTQLAGFALADAATQRCRAHANFNVGHGASVITFAGDESAIACAVRVISLRVQTGALSDDAFRALRARLATNWREAAAGERYESVGRAWTFGLGHPVARVTVPTPGAFERLSGAAVRAVLATRYDPEQCALMLVGAFDPGALTPRLEAAVAGWAPLHLGPRPALGGAVPRRAVRTVVIDQERRELATIQLLLPVPDHSEATRVRSLVLRAALGDGPGSRFNRAVRETLGATYAVLVSPRLDREAQWFEVTGAVRIARVSDALLALQHEMERLRRDGLDEAEVAGARAHLRAQLVRAWETDETLTSEMATVRTAGLEVDSLRELLDEVSRVTRDDVNRLARQMLAWDESTALVYGPSALITRQLQDASLQPVATEPREGH